MKRIFDLIFSFLGLLISSPLIVITAFLIKLEDGGGPFYIAKRVGKNGKLFKMIKLRSMILKADSSGVDSTSNKNRKIYKEI